MAINDVLGAFADDDPLRGYKALREAGQAQRQQRQLQARLRREQLVAGLARRGSPARPQGQPQSQPQDKQGGGGTNALQAYQQYQKYAGGAATPALTGGGSGISVGGLAGANSSGIGAASLSSTSPAASSAFLGTSTAPALPAYLGGAAAPVAATPVAAPVAATPVAAPVAGAAGGAGSGGASMLAAAGPWAALAAVVAGNEIAQNKAGNRPEDFGQWMGDIATGKVLERDMERYLGKPGKEIAGLFTPHGQFETVKESITDPIGHLSKPFKWIGKLF